MHTPMRAAPWRGLGADLKVGYRRLLRSSSFTAVAALSIGLSTTALTTVFSVLNATDFRTLPYAGGDRLSILYTTHDSASSSPGGMGPAFDYSAFAEYRRRSRSFERLEAVSSVMKVEDVDGVAAARLAGHGATPGFLPMLSVRPLLGRWITESDTVSGAERVAVLSHSYWTANFGGDASVIGKHLALRERFPANAPTSAYTIVGVLPRDFVWDATTSFWIPITANEPRSTATVSPVGLMRSGLPAPVANAEVLAIGRDLGDIIEQTRPPGDRSLGGKLDVRTTPLRTLLHEQVGGQTSRLALFGLAFCVFVLAIANVLFLTFLNAQARRVEFAVRRALGASRRRIARQMLLEAALLTIPASLVGLVVCPPLIRLTSDKLNVAALGVAPSLDGAALAFAGLVALLVTVILGLAPGLLYASRDFADGIAARGMAVATKVSGPHRLLVILESALALVVLTGAGLVVKELGRLQYRELGYTPRGVALLASPVGPPRPAAEVVVRGTDALARVRGIPGVTRAAVMATDMSVHLRSDVVAARLAPTVPRSVFGITPEYFSLLHIPIMSGRSFASSDDAAHPAVTILSAEAARRLFPGVDPVGRKLALTGMGPTDIDTWTTVVGVAGDARVREDPLSPKQAVVYRPFSQSRPFGIQLLAQTSGPGSSAFSALRDVAAQLADVPAAPWTVKSLDDDVSTYLSGPRFSAVSLSTLGLIGLSLALVGIFGITAYSVSTRTREIAIRVALGAEARRIVVGIVRESAVLVLLGLCLGAMLSAASSRLMTSLLHGSSALDLTVYLAASSTLMIAALVACLLPARRALTIDPARALRLE